MLIQTANLIGRPLDWAVAKCEKPEWLGNQAEIYVLHCGYSPSTNWAQAGPITAREGIAVKQRRDGCWRAYGKHHTFIIGDTQPIAAMRCYVANTLGDEVDVPDELVE